MTAGQWWSQPVAAEGFTASEGIRRQLGRPRLDPLTVLIRETAQNSCDAGLPGRDIDYSVRLHRLSGNRLLAWRKLLLPEPEGSGLGIASALEGQPLLMTIADRGTSGLGGPLRADENPQVGERPDFVNFIRNVGANKAVHLSGGSYGFGKGIIYNVSRCHVIVADTICDFRGRRQRRLIGAALGDTYSLNGRRFTGRHWLGAQDEHHAGPLLDDEAADMAERLGLPRFADADTGTTIAIVDVDLGRQRSDDADEPRDPDEAAEFVVSTMLWNLWPRMIQGRSGRLVCSVKRDGFVNEVPDPERLVELAPFVHAYRSLFQDGQYEVPARRATPQEIGRFAIAEGMAPLSVDSVVAAAAPVDGRAHHCARMRQADLVVDYVPGEPHPDEALQYGAVFRASTEANPYFAEAEPPTHDEWVLDGLRGTPRGVVQLANGFIRDKLQNREGARPQPSGEVTLGPLTGRLSGLVTAGADSAEASTRTRSGGKGRSPALRPRIVEGPELVDGDGDRPQIRALVQLPDWTEERCVRAEPAVVLDGGVEPLEEVAGRPAVIGWRAAESEVTVHGAELTATPTSDRNWEVRVRAEPDAVVRLSLAVRTEGLSG